MYEFSQTHDPDLSVVHGKTHLMRLIKVANMYDCLVTPKQLARLADVDKRSQAEVTEIE